jgi:DNA-binding response OmpR family regulator
VTEPPQTAPLILVADDDEDIVGLIVYRLEHSGYRVITARDGEEALRLALSERPALVIMDVMMPKLDGYELTRRLRSNEETEHVHVILLTARVQADDVDRGFASGADEYICKPFSPQELRSRVQELLDRP